MRATFFVLPKSKKTIEPFGQLGLGNDKLDYIVKSGMELGNHTTLHLSMRSMTPEQIQQEIGNANNEILAAVPGAKIETMAVPMGMFPHNPAYWKFLLDGTYGGAAYHYKAAMDAAWRPMYAPDDKKYKPTRLERIDGTAASPYGIRDWITKLVNRDGYEPYVSDGDPDVISYPRGEQAELNVAKVKEEGKLANPYSPFGGVGGAKPIVDAPASSAAPSPTAPAAGDKPIVSEATGSASPSPANNVLGAGASPAAVPSAAAPAPAASPKPITP
jgi:peptidoglycan/xylan/chitin deacetylase (PgdA/CDA1 family)